MPDLPALIVIGFTNIDVNIFPGRKAVVTPGGAGYFVSLAASACISPVGFVTRIGSDFDKTFLLSRVLSRGVHVSSKPSTRSTQIYHSAEDPTDRTLTIQPGASDDLTTEDIPLEWEAAAKYIHIATMPPRQQSEIFRFVKQHFPKAVISADTDYTFLRNKENLRDIQSCFGMADIIFLNKSEYEELKQIAVSHPFAIVKLDKDGAMCLKSGTITEKVSAPAVRVIDTTGAGDIFAGTFLAHYLMSHTLHDSLRTAVEAASESVAKQGAKFSAEPS